MYKRVFRPLLFRLEPETAHALTLGLMRLVGVMPPLGSLLRRFYCADDKPVEAFGLHFANPVGLAAGYDKDALGWRGLACLGFGHIEVGTVTPLPQPGNPRPRVFRLIEDQGLINRMGFPGKGAQFAAGALHRQKPANLVLGINLGKNKDTPLEEAAGDYLRLMDSLVLYADYLTINVSSPNTIGLRSLQARQELDNLLGLLVEKRAQLAAAFERRLPLLVKLSPDLLDAELDDALDVISLRGVDGVIATNTTLNREGLRSRRRQETGGLSGAPLTQRSLEFVREINRRSKGNLPVIGAGGIMRAEDARAMLDAGAVLVQVYTGLIYSGPGLVREIVEGL